MPEDPSPYPSSDLTVADLLKLSESAASAYADTLEKRLLK